MEQLLTTKLYIPQPRPELVRRPRLFQQLNAASHHKLTLISAPAGFGKTTLLSDWIHSLLAEHNQPNDYRVAWFSLDKSDNDPARFLGYLVAALRRIEGAENSIGAGTLTMLQSPQPLPIEDVLITLINDLASAPDRAILVLDDYHVIESSRIDDAITFLLEHLPAHMHLVIATRDDPRLPLARLRGRGQLAELRAADLRFTPGEAAEFLNQVMHLDLSSEDIAALETRTEGWIAGLQLAAISMRGHHDTASFIQSFSGSHRFVLDYLIEEVLDQQPADIQTFFLQTAILDRLTGPLCDALTGATDGHTTLEMLERANLFIVPLDEERRWYRYHHLFADLLRQRLHQLYPDWAPGLHQNASLWFEQNGYMDEAIEHALYAADFERAAFLIEHIAEQVWTRYEHTKLQRWLDELPEELMFSKPQLCVFHTWSLFATGQQDTAERSLQAAEDMLNPVSEYDDEAAQLRGRIAVTRAFLAFLRNDVQELIQHARQALDYLPVEDLMWRSTAIIALGDAHTLKGEVAEAYDAYLQAAEISRMVGSNAYRIPISLKLSVTLRSMGHLHQTIECCREHLQLANDSGMSRTVVAGFLLAVWGEVLAELNDLEGALDKVNAGVGLTERGRDVIMFGWANLCLIRVLFSRGELDRAETIVQKLVETDRQLDMPAWLATQIAAWQVRIWLAQGQLGLASQWKEQHKQGIGEISVPQLEFVHITYARLLFAQSHLDEATDLLQTMIPITKARGRISRVIEMLIIQALVFQAGDNMNDALLALEHALSLAEPGGFIRIFVDEGPPMAQLLFEAIKRDIAPDYARQLLAAFPTTEPKPTETEPHAPATELIEPLSEREIEVLHLIAEGLTNKEVASRLFLSLNTIKAHARNIYDKLGVHNRTQAVTRARALGILPPV